MSSWAQRIRVVTSCAHNSGRYPHRLEKVKFGVSLAEVCKNDIPGPLLVLILKINKEAPQRKDVFRAPGNQNAMKKLIHFLQAGRLVNVSNYSVYTIASVLKKFLRKIPNGVFGREGEAELFEIIQIDDQIIQQERIHRLIKSLPVYTQRLLVLLFGTFRVIASNSDRGQTGMTSEALGVSVAPSFFQSCVSDGKNARMEDVLRFKVATQIMKQMIDQFAVYDLFGRENYEYYARVTGRVLRVQDEWICSFRYPPPPRGKSAQQNYALKLSLEAEKTWLQCECDRWRLCTVKTYRERTTVKVMHAVKVTRLYAEESQSTPALLTGTDSSIGCSAISLSMIPEHNTLLESCARLSVSLEGPSLFAVQSNQSRSSSSHSSHSSQHMTMDELRAVNRYAESTKSLSYLPQVHERQTARMRTRSEWFLSGGDRVESLDVSNDIHLRPPIGHAGMGTYRSHDDLTRYLGNIGLSTSSESVHAKRPSRRMQVARHHPHRSSSRRNKENGSRSNSFRNNKLSNNDDDGRGRKARAVSFEQPPIVIATSSHQEWCKYSISVDEMDDQPNLSITDCVDGNNEHELMDTSPPIEQHHLNHFKPPRV